MNRQEEILQQRLLRWLDQHSVDVVRVMTNGSIKVRSWFTQNGELNYEIETLSSIQEARVWMGY
jgi:hypothetical protein